MLRSHLFAIMVLSTSCSLFAVSEPKRDSVIAIEMPEDLQMISLKDEPTIEATEKQNTYLEAYLQGTIDARFPHYGVIVTVRNGNVILANLPKDKTKANKVTSYVVKFIADSTNTEMAALRVVNDQEKQALQTSKHNGMWLPQSTVLYPTQVANPHQVSFSGGIRLRDTVAGQVSTPVSFGDQFPLYRWSNVDIMRQKGDLQLEIEGAVFAIFSQAKPSSPLINADYYVGIPLSFAYGRWAHRMRIYHISSHLGDEYMNNGRHEKRLNKSFEAIDYSFAYNITKQIRVYGVAGVVPHSDSEMPMKPLYAEYGMEVRVGRHEWKQLYGTPYLAMHFENWQDNNWKIDANYALGYEWGKLNGMGKKIRVSLEYHSGYSSDGQFSRRRDDYVQARISYAF